MKTDIPLKRLTQRCPHDLLPLFGEHEARVLGVETLEMPSSKSSLDCVLHLQAPDGTTYLHVIEWQGWNDPVLLWRCLGYLSWLGQNRTERPIFLTIVYLKPGDDVGHTLRQELIGHMPWEIHFSCVRLWEHDAQQAIASGAPGLVALSPLMQGATPMLVERAAQQLIHSTTQPTQADVLTALGVFAEPILPAKRFLKLVTKEGLMSSDLFTLVYEDKLAELEQREKAQERMWEQRLAERDQRLAERDQLLAKRDQLLAEHDQLWHATMQDMLENALVLRFPTAPVLLLRGMRKVREIQALQRLHQTILTAPDLTAIEQELGAAT